MPVQPGQILAGKYRVERVLGAGGMGVVVSATHLHLEERVAIKFLLPQALQNAEAVARFGREARAAVKIRGEHVARVIDVGSLENGAPYMVMEHLDGYDLSRLVRDHGPMPPADAVDAVLQACEALAEAHALGIVHRDLKPANLFLTRRPDGTPSIKVLDFGISKLTNASASDHAMTKTTAVMGSPLYMSPEQMTSSRDVDARTDIWAIGVVLYELLSGQVPFNGETLPEICGLILTAAAPDIRRSAPFVPESLQSVLLRCLEKDRTRRFQDVAELARALAPFGSRATSRSLERISRILGSTTAPDMAPPSVPQAQTGRSGPPTQSNWGQTNPGRSNAAPLIAAAVVALVLLAGVGGFIAWRASAAHHDSGPTAATAEAAAAAPAQSAAAPPSAAQAASAPVLVEPTAAPAVAPAVSSKPDNARPSTPAAATKPKPTAAQPAPSALPAAPAAVPAPPAPAAAPAAPKPKRSAEDLLNGRN